MDFDFDINPLAAANLLMGVIGFGWLLIRTTSRWGEYPREIRLMFTATLAILFALLETSSEQLIQDDITPNALIIFAAKLYLLVVLFVTRGTLYRTGTRAPDNGDSINPDRNVAASHLAPPLPGEAQPPPLAAEQATEGGNDEALRRGPGSVA